MLLRRALLPAALLLAWPWPAAAQQRLSLQPTTLEVPQGVQQAELWVDNPGPAPWHGRVRVLGWDQAEGRDHLQETTEVVASPAELDLPAGQLQRVRLVVPAPRPEAGEIAFRVLLEPDQAAAPRYSLPLFLASPGAPTTLPEARVAGPADAPCLQLRSASPQRVRLADLSYRDLRGRQRPLVAGLAGYVLAGGTVCWPLPPAADGYRQGQFRARVNADDEAALPSREGQIAPALPTGL